MAFTRQQGWLGLPEEIFLMGSDDKLACPNEGPVHRVHVDGFWMDRHQVTNAEFRKFVQATGYVTTAERAPDWEELKQQLPPDNPQPAASVAEQQLTIGNHIGCPTRQLFWCFRGHGQRRQFQRNGDWLTT